MLWVIKIISIALLFIISYIAGLFVRDLINEKKKFSYVKERDYADFMKFKAQNTYKNNTVSLDRQTIINLYSVNPDRWETLYDSFYEIYYYLYNSDKGRVFLNLPYEDYVWFEEQRKIKKEAEKKKHEEQVDAKWKEAIIESAQKDIDKLRERAEDEIAEAREITNDIANQLK